jgi:hypothetical protein
MLIAGRLLKHEAARRQNEILRKILVRKSPYQGGAHEEENE